MRNLGEACVCTTLAVSSLGAGATPVMVLPAAHWAEQREDSLLTGRAAPKQNSCRLQLATAAVRRSIRTRG